MAAIVHAALEQVNSLNHLNSLSASPQEKQASAPLWPFALISSALALVFAAVALTYVRRYTLSPWAGLGIYFSFLLQLILVIAPAARASRERLGRWFAGRPRLCFFLLLWCLPYLLYSAGTGDFRWPALLHLVAISAPVLFIYLLAPVRNPCVFAWQDAAVAVLLVGAVLAHSLKGIWNVPINLDFMGRLFLVSVGAWSWIFVRTLPGLGYRLTISPVILKSAALNFLYFALIAIPGGLFIHFTAWHPRWRSPAAFCLDYLEIFLFIAVLEELFFRGFLQTLLGNSLKSPLKGQAIVACLFGLFHILHAPFPNWRYVVLASVAGWFYGSAFRTSGSLMASSLLHAAVDTVWRTWFSRG